MAVLTVAEQRDPAQLTSELHTEQDAAMARLTDMRLTNAEAHLALGALAFSAPAALQRALDTVQRQRAAEPFYPDDDCSDDESAGGDPRSGCAITPTCTLRCYIRHQKGEAQLNDTLADSAPHASGT